MADKSTSGRLVPPQQDADSAFELAYYTNSYPQQTPKAKSIQSCITVLACIAVFIEVSGSLGMIGSIVKFSQIVTKVDGVVQL